MTSSTQLKNDATTSEGCSLPIPVWTEHPDTPNSASGGKQKQPQLVSDDGLHVAARPDDGLQVVVRKPVPNVDGLHVVDAESTDLPPPYESPTGRCLVLPSRAAEWRVKSATDRDIRLSTLAAAVLVNEKVLDGANVELIRIYGDEQRKATADEKTSTFSTVYEIQRSASKTSLRSFRKKAEEQQQQQQAAGSIRRSSSAAALSPASAAGDVYGPGSHSAASSSLALAAAAPSASASSLSVGSSGEAAGGRSEARVARKQSGAERLDRFAEEVATSGKGLAKVIGMGLAAPGAYTHELAREVHNMPRLYGDETVRKDEKIVGFTSGLAAAGKGFGYGLYDGIAGFFVQPVKGAKEEGTKGFVKGFVKGVGGLAVKPAAGGIGLAGHTLMGIQKSIEKTISRKPTEEECVAVASVWQGEEEMRTLTEQEKTAIINSWFAGSR
ncbi:Vacuolar protein sorting-associated protein 13C [Lasiodiplodia theobromae]|uniref:Vacuolar protein sorting-associated protein 13C n=1 Tax=Lasiodiplodia theobromae TaxID=45133 RepID=A0A5N5CZ70_9PEZI|nr:Vacuolar protein sorting-associated protein 13C [Lasiodiplodia theobromae]